jgi:hypothetical protein
MADDWRIEISLGDRGHVGKLTERLEVNELEHDLATAFEDRLVVSRDGDTVFCYAGTREQAEGAARMIEQLAADNGWQMDWKLKRWHPAAEEWEDPDVPLPSTGAEVAEERHELIESEREETAERGYPEFEVRVQFKSHHAASEFADRLHAEGIPNVRRWKYLLIGATDEDSANALAERLRREAGPEATVTAEGSGRAAYDERPSNPFAFLGGLGG